MKLKTWKEIYAYWKSLEVPELTLIDYEFGKHSTYSPWFDKEEKRQAYHSDNPILDTGRHLGSYLRNKPQELKDTYKIFAFLRYKGLYGFFDLVEEPFSKYDTDTRGWWSSQAKNLFPYFQIDSEYFDYRNLTNNSKNIQTLLDKAAETWKDISKRWALVIIPDLMDSDSEEYSNYCDQSKKLHEDREYQEYLRLKAKFEPNQ